jgi:hypothetical protein
MPDLKPPSRVDAPIGFPAPATAGTAPDADQRVNLGPEIQSRLGVDIASHPPRVGQHERSATLRLEELVAAGDTGGVLRHVHELEHGLSVWTVSPWRMLEHLAERAIGRQRGGWTAASPGIAQPGLATSGALAPVAPPVSDSQD